MSATPPIPTGLPIVPPVEREPWTPPGTWAGDRTPDAPHPDRAPDPVPYHEAEMHAQALQRFLYDNDDMPTLNEQQAHTVVMFMFHRIRMERAATPPKVPPTGWGRR